MHLLFIINHPPQKNHLSGLQRRLLKLTFDNVQDLMTVKSELLPIVKRNKAKGGTASAYGEQAQEGRAVRVRGCMSDLTHARNALWTHQCLWTHQSRHTLRAPSGCTRGSRGHA